MTTDYTAHMEPADGQSLAELSRLAELQRLLENEAAQLEAQLEAKQQQLRVLTEETLPHAMDSVGMSEFRTQTGLRIKIADTVRASIPKDRAVEAVAWLDKHGYANLVKRRFDIQFNKEDEVWANKFAADLAKRKRQLNVSQTQTVHPQTLGAFVREQLQAGVDIPLALFGVHRQRISEVEVA